MVKIAIVRPSPHPKLTFLTENALAAVLQTVEEPFIVLNPDDLDGLHHSLFHLRDLVADRCA